jgi:branched-chain amino acid transport system ATP-binding protein
VNHIAEPVKQGRPSGPPGQPEAMLAIEDVSLAFGGVKALSSVSLTAAKGRITSVIGPNGAGKTSLFNVISGFYRAQSGRILVGGVDLTRARPSKRAAIGVARTFQNIALLRGMSVLDNIKLGAHANLRAGLFNAGLRLGSVLREEAELRGQIERDLIGLLELDLVRHKPVEELAYGLQKRVELARALVMRPRLLLLDEPVAGMTHEEKQDMGRLVLDMQKQMDMTVLLIEHDMSLVMDVSDHVVVMNFGKTIAAGDPVSVRANPLVIEAYLGKNTQGANSNAEVTYG